jgi:hypothetical protein
VILAVGDLSVDLRWTNAYPNSDFAEELSPVLSHMPKNTWADMVWTSLNSRESSLMLLDKPKAAIAMLLGPPDLAYPLLVLPGSFVMPVAVVSLTAESLPDAYQSLASSHVPLMKLSNGPRKPSRDGSQPTPSSTQWLPMLGKRTRPVVWLPPRLGLLVTPAVVSSSATLSSETAWLNSVSPSANNLWSTTMPESPTEVVCASPNSQPCSGGLPPRRENAETRGLTFPTTVLGPSVMPPVVELSTIMSSESAYPGSECPALLLPGPWDSAKRIFPTAGCLRANSTKSMPTLNLTTDDLDSLIWSLAKH